MDFLKKAVSEYACESHCVCNSHYSPTCGQSRDDQPSISVDTVLTVVAGDNNNNSNNNHQQQSDFSQKLNQYTNQNAPQSYGGQGEYNTPSGGFGQQGGYDGQQQQFQGGNQNQGGAAAGFFGAQGGEQYNRPHGAGGAGGFGGVPNGMSRSIIGCLFFAEKRRDGMKSDSYTEEAWLYRGGIAFLLV